MSTAPSDDELDATGVVNVPLETDKLAGRGNVDDVAKGDFGGTETDSSSTSTIETSSPVGKPTNGLLTRGKTMSAGIV